MSSERVRSLFAVAAGFAGTNIISLLADNACAALVPQAFDAQGRPLDTHGLLLLLAGTLLAGVGGGYLTARMAGRRHVTHAAALGAVQLVFAVVASILTWKGAPVWFHLATLVLIVPAAVLGGKIRTVTP
jgi:hypothetical protein